MSAVCGLLNEALRSGQPLRAAHRGMDAVAESVFFAVGEEAS